MEHCLFHNERRRREMISVFLKKIIPVVLSLGVLIFLEASNFNFADDTSSIERIDFANGLLERGLYQMAIDEYKKFIESFPDNEYLHEAHFGVAESHFFSKQYKEAIEKYEKYIKLFPEGDKISISKLRIGQSFFFIKKYDGALQRLTEVKSDALDNNFRQLLYFYTGKTYKAQGDKKQAVRYFERTQKALQESEHANYALLEIGDIYLEDSDRNKADEYYKKAYNSANSDKIKSLALYKQAEIRFSIGDYAGSTQIFKKVLKKYPKQEISQDAFANLILTLFNTDKHEEIISEYHNNENIIQKDKRFFNVYYVVTCAYLEFGRYNDAILLLNEILSFHSVSEEDREKALLKKSEALLKARRFNEAVDLIESKLKNAPRNRGYIMLLEAEACYELGQFDRAHELYKRIIDEFSSSPFVKDALYGMAYVQNSLGKGEEAHGLFVKYFEEGKDNTKRQNALYNAVLISAKSGHTEKAIEYSKTYLSTFKESGLTERVLFRLGSLYSEIKRHDEAVNIFRRFIGQFAKSDRLQEAYFLLAHNLQLSKNFDEALKYYGKISQDRGEDKLQYSALKNIALIYLNKKEENNAIRVFDRIITEFKENDLGIEVYLWLGKSYLALKKFDDTLRIMQQAEFKVGPSSDKIGEIAYFKAEAYRELQDYKRAIKSYDITFSSSSIELYSGASHIGRGVCFARLNDFEKAKAEFEKAILDHPADNTVTMRAKFELANIEQLKNNLEEACKLYMLVAILYKDNYYCPEALFRAGQLYETLGKRKEAVKVYREIVDTYKKSHPYKNARKRIKDLSG